MNDDKGFDLINRHASPEMLKSLTARMKAFQSLEGQELDFGGRVSKASVKNF